MKTTNKILGLILCFVYPLACFADAINETSGTSVAPPTSPSTISLPGGGTVLAPAAPTTAPTSTINQGANTGQQSQSNGSGINNAAGAALIAAGTPMLANPPTVPTGMALIAMGILALMQGGEDSGAAGQSGNTAALSAYGNSSNSGNGSSATTDSASQNALDGGTKAAFSSAAGQQAVAAVAAAGGTLTPNGLTMPDGTSYPLSTFSSPASMSAAGFDAGSAMKVAANIEKSLVGNGSTAGSTSGMAMSEGAGGASVASQFGKDNTPFKMPKFNSPFDLSNDQKARMVAGKTVSMGGDPIGVRGDDLFAMIHRAYVRKAETNNFITTGGGDTSAGVLIRAPASMIKKGR